MQSPGECWRAWRVSKQQQMQTDKVTKEACSIMRVVRRAQSCWLTDAAQINLKVRSALSPHPDTPQHPVGNHWRSHTALSGLAMKMRLAPQRNHSPPQIVSSATIPTTRAFISEASQFARPSLLVPPTKKDKASRRGQPPHLSSVSAVSCRKPPNSSGWFQKQPATLSTCTARMHPTTCCARVSSDTIATLQRQTSPCSHM